METIGDGVQKYHETAGSYLTEDDAKDAIREAFSDSPYFKLHEEVDCWYFGGSVFGDKPTGRIDFILSPRAKLIEAGWTMGLTGIECKKSGHKVGPLLCQMIDYSKSVFRMPSAGILACATTVCCFPEVNATGTIGSVMANHRLGRIIITRKQVRIQVNATNIFSLYDDELTVKSVNCGYKNGSR